WTQGGVHPVARLALLDTDKTNALDFKFSANQRIQIDARDEGVAPRRRGLSEGQIKFAPESLQDFQGKERDLPFVVFLEVEEAIPPDTTAGNAVDLIHFHDRILAGRLTVVVKEVVTCGDE